MIEYIVCFNHRSGSSWLTSLLGSSGLGPCWELLKDRDLKELGPCTGIKIVFPALETLQSQVNIDNCKLIRLNRRDKIRQAISYYRADFTEKWSSFDKHECCDPPFDRNRIMDMLDRLDEEDEEWERWLEDKEYLDLWYEDLLADPMKILQRIADFIEKPIVKLPITNYEIQRDDLTETFYKNFTHKS